MNSNTFVVFKYAWGVILFERDYRTQRITGITSTFGDAFNHEDISDRDLPNCPDKQEFNTLKEAEECYLLGLL